MPPPTIMIDYANVERLIGYFRQHQAKVAAIQSRLESQLNVLGRGGWQSSAATKFYADCIPVLEGVGRLSSALGSGAATLEHVTRLFLEAEREGADAIPTPPGFMAVSAKLPDSASKITGGVQQAVEPTPNPTPEPGSSDTPAATPTPDGGVRAQTPTPTPEGGIPGQTPTVTPAQTPVAPLQAPADAEPAFRYPYSPAPRSLATEVSMAGIAFPSTLTTMSNMLPYARAMGEADGPSLVGDAGGSALMLGAFAVDVLILLGLLGAVTPVPHDDAGAGEQSGETADTLEEAMPPAAEPAAPLEPGHTYTTPNGETWSTPADQGRKSKQYGRRGWTEEDISDVIDDPAYSHDRAEQWETGDSATAYYGEDGHYILRNDQTGEVFEASNRSDTGWKDNSDPLNPNQPITPRPRGTNP